MSRRNQGVRSLSFVALAALALGVAAGCGSDGKPGSPSGLSSSSPGAGAGGGGGGGGGAFTAIGWNDKLIYGPGTATIPELLNVVCELDPNATQYVLTERDKGTTGAFAPTPNQAAGQTVLTNGVFWSLDLPGTDKEYQVEAQDAAGAVVSISSKITTDLAGPLVSIGIQVPTTGTWADFSTGNLTTPPTVAAPTAITWTPTQTTHYLYCLEIAPNASGANPTYLFDALSLTGSFDLATGFYFEGPAATPPFASGKQYLMAIVGCGPTNWGTATSIDLFSTAPGWSNGSFIVQ